MKQPLLLACLVGMLAVGAPARADNAEEYHVKAGILFNFIAFTEWPAAIGNTLNVCVYGQDPFGADLDKLQGRQVTGRTLTARRMNSVEGLGDCHIVFISRSAAPNLPRALDRTNGKPVLTVADSAGAAQQGVALNMVMAQNKVAFEANVAAARANGLNLSSKLLRLATEVFQ
ncbi:MAG TPA: YfiR family protein [Burkholderiales bacterium]|nr:YfiR family protein [Burkholderiales bacterium]